MVDLIPDNNEKTSLPGEPPSQCNSVKLALQKNPEPQHQQVPSRDDGQLSAPQAGPGPVTSPGLRDSPVHREHPDREQLHAGRRRKRKPQDSELRSLQPIQHDQRGGAAGSRWQQPTCLSCPKKTKPPLCYVPDSFNNLIKSRGKLHHTSV